MNALRPAVFTLPCVFVAVISSLAQGPLNPPGPPAPTMKTLAQAEPRIPIESLPFTVGVSGSYYLTRNLEFTGTSGAAITVNASNVTLDLMGFTLSSTASATGNGIIINGNGATVKNGSIVGTTSVAISGSGASRTWQVTPGGFSVGVQASGNGHRLVDLTVAKCRDDGLRGGSLEQNSVITRCVAYQNGGNGITAAGVVTECSAFENAGAGINAGQNLGGVVTSCRSYDNKLNGIWGNVVANCMSQSNGAVGINAIKVSDCTVSFNGSHGIENATSVSNCTARSNGGDGIRALNTRDNTSTGNTGAGIRFSGDGGRIEGNNCHNNLFGIQSTADTNSFIVRNSARGNGGTPTNVGASGNFDFDRGTNTYGPVITVNGNLNANADASHPAANIQY